MARHPRLRQALRRSPDGPLGAGEDQEPLAEELLFGKLVNGGEVKVRIKDNAPAFEIGPCPAQGAEGEEGPRPPRREKASGDAPDERSSNPQHLGTPRNSHCSVNGAVGSVSKKGG